MSKDFLRNADVDYTMDACEVQQPVRVFTLWQSLYNWRIGSVWIFFQQTNWYGICHTPERLCCVIRLKLLFFSPSSSLSLSSTELYILHCHPAEMSRFVWNRLLSAFRNVWCVFCSIVWRLAMWSDHSWGVTHRWYVLEENIASQQMAWKSHNIIPLNGCFFPHSCFCTQFSMCQPFFQVFLLHKIHCAAGKRENSNLK